MANRSRSYAVQEGTNDEPASKRARLESELAEEGRKRIFTYDTDSIIDFDPFSPGGKEEVF
ncbi:hypothetical protein ZHAS_00014365 [Anopheles sinensis]|uniref:Uncharacterized protein n=1 Tax=Anopheles sinensis TaxID=74873 RepID=A0A084W829_ANOSI|nr:hypothetical protein ZHAS_00014365 [Anopheles sinensis]